MRTPSRDLFKNVPSLRRECPPEFDTASIGGKMRKVEQVSLSLRPPHCPNGQNLARRGVEQRALAQA